MFAQNKWLWDSLLGGGLFLALLVIILLNLGGNNVEEPDATNTLKVVVNPTKEEPVKKDLKLAVTTAEKKYVPKNPNDVELWDDMGKLLKTLGEGYSYDSISTKAISQNEEMLKRYDVVFLTCAPNTGPDISGILRNYVARGGTLYASDYRFDILEKAFPDLVYLPHKDRGNVQTVTANVRDASLRDALGSNTIDLKFDLNNWKTAAFRSPPAEVLLDGQFKNMKNDIVTTPLLVRFPFGDGTVIFTSFHNEKVNHATAEKMLQYLVFRLVNAEVEKVVNTKIQKGGFTPQKSNLLSTAKDDPKVTKTYTHDSGKPLRFALGFRNAGAKLKFKITSPKGKTYTGTYTSTVVIDVPEAPKGEWTYEVIAEELPYPNFPFHVSVGEKE